MKIEEKYAYHFVV